MFGLFLSQTNVVYMTIKIFVYCVGFKCFFREITYRFFVSQFIYFLFDIIDVTFYYCHSDHIRFRANWSEIYDEKHYNVDKKYHHTIM